MTRALGRAGARSLVCAIVLAACGSPTASAPAPTRPPEPATPEPAAPEPAAPEPATPEPVSPQTPPNPPSGPTLTGPITRAEVGAPASARCLPVVAAECGCTYACGIGWSADGVRYTVRHRFWDSGRSALNARVDRWCVDGACTDAFFGEIVCSGICAPTAADPACHFDGDACVGAADGR